MRATAGLTRDALASKLDVAAGDRELGVNGVAIWKWERGRHDVSRPYRKLLGIVCERELAAMDPVTRREFIRRINDLIGVGMLGMPAIAADPERLGAAFGHLSRLDEQVLSDLEAITQDLARRHRATAPRSLLRSVTGHFMTLKDFFQEAPSQLRPRLFAAAGDVAVLAGWLGWFADNRGDAEAWWRHAGKLAEAAGDASLQAHVLVAHSALYSTHGWRTADAAESLRMLDGALALAGTKAPPRLHAWIYARRAEEHAILGDAGAAGRDLDIAEHDMAVARAEEGTYAGARDVLHTFGYRGNCAMHLGDGQQAEACLSRVLDGTPESYHTARCWSLMDRSIAQAQLDDDVGASESLINAAELADAIGLSAYVQRVRGIRQQHLARWPTSVAVAGFDERFRAIVNR